MTNIDITKLENVKFQGDSIISACPACRTYFSRDKQGNHFSLLKNGKFSCVVFPGDKIHNKQILELVGTGDSSVSEGTIEYEEKIEVERTYDVSSLNRLVKNYEYWEKRGISASAIEEFRGGIATEGQMKNRWVFPIFNQNEEIIGFAGRDLTNQSPIRWKNLGKVSKWIFGDLDSIESESKVILVEGIGCVLALRQAGIDYGLSLFGVNISQTVLGKLISMNIKNIVIATNNDEKHSVGQAAALKIKNKLDKLFNDDISIIHLPIKKDFLDMSKEEILLWCRDIRL